MSYYFSRAFLIDIVVALLGELVPDRDINTRLAIIVLFEARNRDWTAARAPYPSYHKNAGR
jgi:hypothetical protein